MSKLKDLLGLKFERLTVVERAPNSKTGQAYWHCECKCGSASVVRGAHLMSGRITSCGCYSREFHTSHGLYRTPEYRAYYNMIKRCEYENDVAYADYGMRGIKVCHIWRESFERFIADMGPRPSDEHSIDRINVDGDYGPGNCRWASVEVQERNKRIRWDSLTGTRGVVINQKTGKYIAQIYTRGKNKRIGTFGSLEVAVEARKEAERKYWGTSS